MTDFIFYYLFTGFAINLVLGTLVLIKGFQLDMLRVGLAVLVWPFVILDFAYHYLFKRD